MATGVNPQQLARAARALLAELKQLAVNPPAADNAEIATPQSQARTRPRTQPAQSQHPLAPEPIDPIDPTEAEHSELLEAIEHEINLLERRLEQPAHRITASEQLRWETCLSLLGHLERATTLKRRTLTPPLEELPRHLARPSAHQHYYPSA